MLDLAGFGMGHMKILNLLKTYNALFAWHYPESIAKFVVINAPLPFTARVIKGFMHPITVQKVHIVGSNYESYLADIGVELPPGPAGDLRQRVNGWHAELDALLARARPRRSHAAGRGTRRPPTSPSCASSASPAAHD